MLARQREARDVDEKRWGLASCCSYARSWSTNRSHCESGRVHGGEATRAIAIDLWVSEWQSGSAGAGAGAGTGGKPGVEPSRRTGHVASHLERISRAAPRSDRPCERIRWARMKATERESDAWQWTSAWPPAASVASMAFETASKCAIASPAKRRSSATLGSAQSLVVGLP